MFGPTPHCQGLLFLSQIKYKVYMNQKENGKKLRISQINNKI